jgi:hypothetical protein
MTIVKKHSNKTKKKSVKKSVTKRSPPLFIPTEGEDSLEANISFLISIMGGSLFDDYVTHILIPITGIPIDVIQVSRPTDSKNLLLIDRPTIFYGYKATHFTCSYDTNHLWDSYKEGIQLGATDHFCQTFALMRMEYELLPDSFIGKKFAQLRRGEFLLNAWIAKTVACHIIRTMISYYSRSKRAGIERMDELVDDQLEGHSIHSSLTIKNGQELLIKLLECCEPLTINDFSNSSFREKILLVT